MARSRQPATLTDVDTLRSAQEQLGSKVQHDMREIRERIDQTPDRYRQQWEALALDLDGARAEIANLATNITKLRQENVANTSAVRQDLTEMRTALTEMRTAQEGFGPLFEKFDERLANGLTRIASQISDSEGVITDGILAVRAELAAFRGDVQAQAKQASEELEANAGAILDKLFPLPDQISVVRAEVRAELRDLAAWPRPSRTSPRSRRSIAGSMGSRWSWPNIGHGRGGDAGGSGFTVPHHPSRRRRLTPNATTTPPEESCR